MLAWHTCPQRGCDLPAGRVLTSVTRCCEPHLAQKGTELFTVCCGYAPQSNISSGTLHVLSHLILQEPEGQAHKDLILQIKKKKKQPPEVGCTASKQSQDSNCGLSALKD